jgi:vacuolar-type H+-ATPase catalytic subunit A/Vma1
MGVKLNKETSDIIYVSQMKEGKLYEVVNWEHTSLLGKVIQRIKDDAIVIGSIERILAIDRKTMPKCNQVQILKNGETLTIENNE